LVVGKSKADKKKREEKERKERRREEKREREKADDPKAGADVGKIVNLMAGDANKVINSYLWTCFVDRVADLDCDFLFGVRYRKWCRGRISFMEVSMEF
jgi:hypothetical protein